MALFCGEKEIQEFLWSGNWKTIDISLLFLGSRNNRKEKYPHGNKTVQSYVVNMIQTVDGWLINRAGQD